MTHSKMCEVIDHIMEQVDTMREAGQKEYAHDTKDVFANFNRISNLLDCDRKKVLLTYMLKHIDGISAYVKGHKSQREDVRGRITDTIVYLMLLWGMIEEEDGSISGKKDNPSMHNMWNKLEKASGSLPEKNGSVLVNGVHNESDLQKVREERLREKVRRLEQDQ